MSTFYRALNATIIEGSANGTIVDPNLAKDVDASPPTTFSLNSRTSYSGLGNEWRLVLHNWVIPPGTPLTLTLHIWTSLAHPGGYIAAEAVRFGASGYPFDTSLLFPLGAFIVLDQTAHALLERTFVFSQADSNPANRPAAITAPWLQFYINGTLFGSGETQLKVYDAYFTATYEPLVISCGNPPDGVIGIAYSHTIPGSGGGGAPFTFAITSGALPPGLTIAAATGIISGTPTTAGGYAFTVRITDSGGGQASVGCSITILPPLSIVCGSPPNGKLTAAYSHTFPVTGGNPPYTFAIISGALPPGLTLGTSTGTVTGTPTLGGVYTFQVRVTDALGQTASVQCAIQICPIY